MTIQKLDKSRLDRFVNGHKPPGHGTEPFRRIYVRSQAPDSDHQMLYREGARRAPGDAVPSGAHLARTGRSNAGGWTAGLGIAGLFLGPAVGIASGIAGGVTYEDFIAGIENSMRVAVPSWVSVMYRLEDPPRQGSGSSMTVPFSTAEEPPGASRQNAMPYEPREYVREVQGWLAQSFLSPEDFPLLPWHTSYDWNFHFVIPEESPYRYLLSARYASANDRHKFECEWDTGALSDVVRRGFQNPGPDATRDQMWPMTGWYTWLAGRWIYDCGHPWPDVTELDQQPGESSETYQARVGPLRQRPGETDQDYWNRRVIEQRKAWHTELHPCMAMATWRVESVELGRAGVVLVEVQPPEGAPPTQNWSAGAHWFPRPGVRLPAAQFQFFAAKRGGHYEFRAAGDSGPAASEEGSVPGWGARDFHFLVDLPPVPPRPVPHAGPSSTAATGTQTVVGQRWPPPLLVAVDFPFVGETETPPPVEEVDVMVLYQQPTGSAGAGGATRTLPVHIPTGQALVRIPRETLARRNEFGVRVSCAWAAEPGTPLEDTVRVRVRIVTARFQKVQFRHGEWHRLDHRMSIHTFVLRFGINGRWFDRRFENPQAEADRSITDVVAEIYLPRSGAIEVSADGFGVPDPNTLDVAGSAIVTSHALSPVIPVHEFLNLPETQRSITVRDRRVEWHDLVTAQDAPVNPRDSRLTVNEITSAMTNKLRRTMDLENVTLAHAAARHMVDDVLTVRGGYLRYALDGTVETRANQGPLTPTRDGRGIGDLVGRLRASAHALPFAVEYVVEAAVVPPPRGAP